MSVTIIQTSIRGPARIERAPIEHVEPPDLRKPDALDKQRMRLSGVSAAAAAAGAAAASDDAPDAIAHMSSEIEPVQLMDARHAVHAATCMMCSYASRTDILSITPYKVISETIKLKHDGCNTELVVRALTRFMKVLKRHKRLPASVTWEPDSMRYHLLYVATTPRSVAAAHARRIDTMLDLLDASALKVRVKSTGRNQLNVGVSPLALQMMRHRERLEDKIHG